MDMETQVVIRLPLKGRPTVSVIGKNKPELLSRYEKVEATLKRAMEKWTSFQIGEAIKKRVFDLSVKSQGEPPQDGKQ
jgi:hypothetical protein